MWLEAHPNFDNSSIEDYDQVPSLTLTTHDIGEREELSLKVPWNQVIAGLLGHWRILKKMQC